MKKIRQLVTMTFEVDDPLWCELRTLRLDRGITRSWIVRQAIREYLAKQKDSLPAVSRTQEPSNARTATAA